MSGCVSSFYPHDPRGEGNAFVEKERKLVEAGPKLTPGYAAFTVTLVSFKAEFICFLRTLADRF